MTSFARAERSRLCDLALETGPDAPTLCGDWDVRHLLAHLLVRETSPLAAGIVVPPLAAVTDRKTGQVAKKKPFERLVDRIRNPRNPMALPGVDAIVNTAEYFVHHEDIRRAVDGWEPRVLEAGEEDALWKVLRVSGKGLVRPAGVPVVARRVDTGDETTLKAGDDPVVVTGLPSELVLFVYGRGRIHGLEFAGPADRVAKLRKARLGI